MSFPMQHHHDDDYGRHNEPSMEYNYDYNDPYNGMGIHNNEMSVGTFLMHHDVRQYWIAFFALWVWWGLFWFIRHVFGDGHASTDYVPAEAAAGETSRPNVAWVRRPGVARTHSRLSRASDVLRDLVLMLLSVLLLNTLFQGGTRNVMILTWVFFAFAVFWSIFEAAKEHHVARFIFAIIFYGISLAIGVIAIKHGFSNHLNFFNH